MILDCGKLMSLSVTRFMAPDVWRQPMRVTVISLACSAELICMCAGLQSEVYGKSST